jgi:hypothetical protein
MNRNVLDPEATEFLSANCRLCLNSEKGQLKGVGKPPKHKTMMMLLRTVS